MPEQPEDAGPPLEVRELAARRSAARQARDFAAADDLRDQIRGLGWLVTDSPAGQRLATAAGEAHADAGRRGQPGYRVLGAAGDIQRPPAVAEDAGRRAATVALLIEGWPDDLRDCVMALLEYLPPGVAISGLDVGNAGGAGDALHALAQAYPDRITELHVRSGAGWGQARNALLRADPAPVHIVMETSTILTGDAISPLLGALAADGVVAAGWRGADPDPDLRSFHDAGPGPVTALLGYLMAVRKDAASRAGGFAATARFYRNADLEFSLRLGRQGTLVVPQEPLPVRQGRHRGYHDSEPAMRDAESRRNYRRVLDLLRADQSLATGPES